MPCGLPQRFSPWASLGVGVGAPPLVGRHSGHLLAVLVPEAALRGEGRGSHFAGEGTEPPSGPAHHCLLSPDGPRVSACPGLLSHPDAFWLVRGHQTLSSFRLFLLAVRLAWKSSCPFSPSPVTTPNPFLTSRPSSGNLPCHSPYFSYLPASLWRTPPYAFQRAKLRAHEGSVLHLFLSQVPNVVSEQLSSDLIFN